MPLWVLCLGHGHIHRDGWERRRKVTARPISVNEAYGSLDLLVPAGYAGQRTLERRLRNAADDSKTSHTLTDHLLGQDFVHEHDGDADHDHDHFEFDADVRWKKTRSGSRTTSRW